MKLPLLTRLFGAIFPPQDLWKAASIGDVSAIRRLTAAGSDINAKRRTLSVEGDSPLHFAARHSQSEAVRALVGLGAKIDARTDHGTTPLIEAGANMASVETVEALIVMGANINAQDKNGYTALSSGLHQAPEGRCGYGWDGGFELEESLSDRTSD